MRYYLPLVAPWNDDHEYQADKPFANDLSLDAMPKGFTPGEYAFCIVKNLQVNRWPSKGMLANEEHRRSKKIEPTLSLQILVEHLLQYAKSNGWPDDGAEQTMHAMLRNAPQIMWHARQDLEEWPFSGDHCFLAWMELFVEKNMLDLLSKGSPAVMQNHRTSTNIDLCTRMGRWFAQRGHLVELADPIVQQLVRYVHTVESMPEQAFLEFTSKDASTSVMKCDIKTRTRGTKPMFRRKLVDMPRPPCKDARYNNHWSESAFASFALGMAWELRAQGEGLAFERVNQLINKGHQRTSRVLSDWQWDDMVWRKQAMLRAEQTAESYVMNIVKRDHNQGLLDFYPPNQSHEKEIKRHEQLLEAGLNNPLWGHNIYRLALASALRETFASDSYSSSDYRSHLRLLTLAPLLERMAPAGRESLFMEMVQTMVAIGQEQTMGRPRHAKPWTMLASTAYNAWSINVEEDDNSACTEMSHFVEWLNTFEHPFVQDLNVLGSIAGDMEMVGAHLQQWVMLRMNPQASTPQIEDDLLDGLLDGPL